MNWSRSRSRARRKRGFNPVGATLIALLGFLAAEVLSGQFIAEFFDPRFLFGQITSITGGPDGRLWFAIRGAGSFGPSQPGKIGRMTPSGAIDVFPLTLSPVDITAGSDGNIWFTQQCIGPISTCPAGIGRLTPSGEFAEFAVSGESITRGPDGALWFTRGDAIGRITTEGAFLEFPIPGGRGPRDIATGPDGNLWFTEYSGNRIGRLTPAGVLTEFPIPRPMSQPAAIAAGPDGHLWFTEEQSGYLGRISTQGVITEFAATEGPLRGIAAGSDGNVWFTSPARNSIGRMTPFGQLTLFQIPTPSSFPLGITSGPDGNIWFTEVAAWQIGNVDLRGATCSMAQFAACLGNRFEVAIEWRVPSQGTVGAGAALPLTADTAAFWFFSNNNIEVVVKVLDGRTVNGSFWVFYGALSDVEYTITVTDTQTGRVKTYFNPAGQLASIADTAAFSN